MNHEKRSITRTESQGKGRGITIKVVPLKARPLDTQLFIYFLFLISLIRTEDQMFFRLCSRRMWPFFFK